MQADHLKNLVSMSEVQLLKLNNYNRKRILSHEELCLFEHREMKHTKMCRIPHQNLLKGTNGKERSPYFEIIELRL